MYERKIPVDLSCPLRLTMSLIDSKWKSCILDELRDAAMRPSELHKALPEATPRVLDLQLKELAGRWAGCENHLSRTAAALGIRHHGTGAVVAAHPRRHDCVGRGQQGTLREEIRVLNIACPWSGRWRHSRTGRAGIRRAEGVFYATPGKRVTSGNPSD